MSDLAIIGSEAARAAAAQRRHEETHGAPDSPLADLGYSPAEHRLWRWVDSPLDSRIAAVVEDFARSGEAERRSMRERPSKDDFYTLFAFSRRRALAILRGEEPKHIEPTFFALAMVDVERVDRRDFIMTHDLVSYAGDKMGAPVAELSVRTQQLAGRETAKVLADRQTTLIDLAESCGCREVQTSEGIVLFNTEYKHFAPQADLAQIAFDIAIDLENNDYEIEDISLASNLPLAWLNCRENTSVAKMARSLSGCVALHGVPRQDPATNSPDQMLLVFLGEAASETDARVIAAAAENASSSDKTELALASGRLFAVVVQCSPIADTPPMENAHSLERLRGVINRSLN